MSSPTWDVIVIGGGAAGLWAAGTAAQRGRKVLVLEKNKKPGVKILMSGGTRCNITHHCDIRGLLDVFGEQGRFLKAAVHQLSPEQVVAEVNRLGVATKVEASGKVFPVSNRAIDVRDALLDRLRAAGAELQTGVAVQNLKRSADDGKAGTSSWFVQLADQELTAAKILLCCGGLSYAGCGTTGDGYAWATQAGHSLVQTAPALTPLVSPANWVHELSGITLPDAEARVLIGDRRIKDPRAVSRGGFLWTHFGCSGPVPMNVSRYVSVLDQPQSAVLQLDMLPDIHDTELLAHFDPAQHGKRRVSSVLQSLVPKNLAQTLGIRSGLAEETTVAELPKKVRQAVISNLKHLKIPLSGTRGYPKAEVTRGGVATNEVNPRTMESRLAPGLYFAGEILNIDGPIGGYNFQAAFSTGHLAALQI